MKFIPQILYKRAAGLTLMALVVLAAILRWWGAGWPPLHPDEWTARIVQHVHQGNWYSPQPIIWHEALFVLLGHLYGPINFIFAGFINLLNQAGTAAIELPILLYGRVMVGALCALNVWAIYRLWLRLHPWRAGGLVAAALLAVSPLLVAQSHYLTVDAPLALAITFCLWSSVYLYQTGRWWAWLVAGLAAGLAITTKSNSLVILGSVGLAHLLHVLDRKPRWYLWLLAQPAMLLAGLATGMCLGFPGFLFGEAGPIARYTALATKFTAPRYSSSLSFLESTFGDRLTWSMRTITDAVGWELIALFVLGLALVIWQRRRSAWIVASYPFLFYFPYLIIGNRVGERDLPSTVPSLILLSVYFLAYLSQRLVRGQRWQAGLLGVFCLLTAAWPLWRSVGTSYLYWQDDTRISAAQWVNATLPADARLFTMGYAPHGVDRAVSQFATQKYTNYFTPHNFLCFSSAAEDRNFFGYSGRPIRARGNFLLKLDKEALLIKEFDLKTPRPEDKRPGRFKFPLFVDPYLKIYAGRPNREIGQPLALEHPSAFSQETSRITYTNHPDYSLDEAVGICDSNGRLTRVLRPPHELDSVEVELVNLGSVATRVCLSQGLFQGESIDLLPGQTWRKRLDPMNCPAPVERVYPFSLECDPPQPVLMRLVSDPLLMGLRALERGQWDLAQETLEPAQAENPQALVSAGLLAAALSQTGQAQAAAGLLQGRDKELESLAALAGSGLSATEWPKRLEEFSGYYPDLLFNALKRRYPLPVYDLPDWHWRRSRRGSGSSCSVVVSSLPEDQGVGSLAEVRAHDFFPDLPLTAKVRLTWPGSFGPAAKPLAELRALRRGPAGDLKLKPRPIRAEELGDSGQAEFSLDLPAGDHEGRWEIGLACFSDHRIRISELSIQVDPRATLARQARWVLLAWGRTLAQRGDQAGAARVWEILGRVSPGFAPALTEQIKTMSAVGRNQALSDLLGESLPELQGRPDLLARAAHALEGMGRAELAGEYRRQLAKLQPDSPLGISFANGVNLAGYSLSDRQVKPGGELHLRLYWSFPKALDFDWAIFTHLNRPGGQVNFDHHLDQGRLRMDKLRPGEMVVDNVPLQFDAKTQPGQYTVKVGLYWGGLGRVAMTSGSPEGDDSADLGKITVLPADKP